MAATRGMDLYVGTAVGVPVMMEGIAIPTSLRIGLGGAILFETLWGSAPRLGI
jgi:hypothetical protein